MDICELLCNLQDAVADGETQQVLSILKEAPPDVTSLFLTSSLDDENTTLLHISASHPTADILRALLKHGAEVDWQNFDGMTALHVAATWGSGESVRTLLERGANPLIRDGEGLLPVDHARTKGHIECVHLLEGHSIDNGNDDSSLSDDDDHTHLHPDPRATEEEEGPPDPRQMSMAEAFVSMYSDSTSSDSELNDDNDNDLTSVTQISFSPSSVYDYTPSPPNRSRSYPPAHYNSLTRQKLVYSPTKSVSGDSESKDTYFSPGCMDDSALYTTAVEESESFAVNRSTIVVGRAKSVVGGANSVERSRDSESLHVADSSLEGSYAAERSIRCRKQEKQIDLLSDDFSNLITSTNQIRPTTSAATRPTPPSKTRQSRLTDSSDRVHEARPHVSEQRTSSTPSSLDCSFAADIQVKIPEKLRSLTESELRERLVALGERPGPITPSTKIAYIAYLAKLEAGVQPAGNKGYKGYKYELALVLNGTVPLPDLTQLEQQVFKAFRTPSHSFTPSPIATHRSQNSTPSSSITSSTKKRATPITKQATPLSPFKTPPKYGSPRAAKDRGTKDHFNYLLLDPRVLERLSSTSDSNLASDCGGDRKDLEKFRVFVESVFYVGKGKNSRSMQHLKDAKDSINLQKSKVSMKLCRILDIWSAGFGVISLQLFHNTTASEAFTREACIIEAIGLDLLTNIQRGHVYGDVSGWSLSRRRQLGVHLLHKAYQSYRLHTPQQIYQTDL